MVYGRDLLAGEPFRWHVPVAVLLLVGLAAFLLAVFLTRRTRLLEVEGR
jgi:hypothetical protein